MNKIKVNIDSIPDQLKEKPNWVGWKLKKRNGELSKVPYNVTTGEISNAYNPETWVDLDTLKNKPQYHLGFAFNKTPFAGVDLDGCRDPDTGEIATEAQKIIDQLNSYTEVSPSGTGLHVLVEGSFTGDGNKTGNVDGFKELEMYHTDRYFTVTGNHLKGTPKKIRERSAELQVLQDDYFPDRQPPTAEATEGEGTGLPDGEVLDKARNDASGDLFEQLWEGNEQLWEGSEAKYNSHSEADFALISKLAFYTGPDVEQIDRLFRRSGLMRAKWDGQRGDNTYGRRTIERALSGMNNFYNSNRKPANAPPVDLDEPSTGGTTSPPQKEGEPDPWNAVGKAYGEREKQRARLLASEILQNEREFAVLPEGDQFLVYKEGEGYFTDYGEEFIKARLQSRVPQNLSRYELNEITAHVERSNYQREKDFGPENKHLICVKNGVLNLRSGELLDHSPDYEFRQQIPTRYDSEANSEVLDNFLQETLKTEDDIELIEEIAGHCLYRDYVPQRAIMFYGEGSNGKGVTLDLIESMLGSDNVANKNLQRFTGQNQRFGKQFLYKKLANIAGDLPSHKLHETSTFKELTGQDSIEAEVKNANRTIKFKNYATMIFSANKIPQSPDDTDAFHRRWIMFTFPYQFVNDPQGANEKQRDPKLRDKLNTPGVKAAMLNRAVEGWQRLNDRGRFSYDPSTSEARKLWQRRARPIKAFAESNLETGEEKWEFKSKVYKRYKKYCKENGIPEHEIKQQSQFSKELRKYVDWKDSRPKDPETGRQRTAYDGFELIDIPF